MAFRGFNCKALRVIFLFFFYNFLFTACTFNISNEMLISLPALSDLEKKIYEVIPEIAAEDYSLVFAERGKYQNPINFVDINSDGIDEIVVAYRSALTYPENGNYVNICILDASTDELYPLINIRGNGDEIDKIDFCDFQGNGVLELIVGYISTHETRQKELCIYNLNLDDGEYEKNYAIKYMDWLVTDIDNDGTKELLYLNYDLLNSLAIARRVDYDPMTGVIDAFLGGDRLVYSSNYYSIHEGRAKNGEKIILVFAKRGSLLSSTEVIIWDSKFSAIKNVSNESYTIGRDGDRLDSRYLSYGRYSPQDIDGDEITEIIICSETNESIILKDQSMEQEYIKYKYNLYEYNEMELIKDFSCYINEKQFYYFVIRDDWDFNNIVVYTNYKNDLLFYYKGNKLFGNIDKILLFSLIQSSVQRENASNELKYIKEIDKYYYLNINENLSKELAALIPPKDEIKQAIHIQNILVAPE